MASPTRQAKRLALDTNVLLDLASGRNFATDFVKRFQERGYDLRVPPTVLIELAYFDKNGTGDKKQLAHKALTSLSAWRIAPVVLSQVDLESAESFKIFAEARKLLPPE